MKANEAHDLALMLKAATGGRVEPDTLSLFEHQFASLDAEAATQAVVAGITTWKRFPSWAEFLDAYRSQRRLGEADPYPFTPRTTTPRDMPDWIKRYACARFLYRRFGREQDMRVFDAQLPQADPLAERMPAGEWEAEAAQITDNEAWRAVLAVGE